MDNKDNTKKWDTLNIENSDYFTEVPDSFKNRKPYAPLNPKELLAAIPGSILEIFLEEGAEVQEGDQILILEAMKMRNLVVSPIDGKIKSIVVKSSDVVRKNQLLVEFE